MKPTNALRSFLLGSAIAALLGTHSSQAASQIWDGGGADANWSNAINWVGDPTAPGATSGTTNTDLATFNAAIANTWGLTGSPILIDSGRNIGGISFDTAAGSYFIGNTAGNNLILSNTGTIQILSTLAGTGKTMTINAPIVLTPATATTAGAYTFTNNATSATNTLNFGGGISAGTTSNTETLTLRGTNTGTNTISGNITRGSATTFALIKTDAGTWSLTGQNTYNGVTTVSGGKLIVDGTGTLNGTGFVTVGSVGTTGTMIVRSSSANAINVTATGAPNLEVGVARAAGTAATGTLHMAAGMGSTGTITTNDVNIGFTNTASTTATGVVFQSAGIFTVRSGRTMNLGIFNSGAGSTASGTYNIDGGLLNVLGNLYTGSSNNTATVSSATGALNVSGAGVVTVTGIFQPLRATSAVGTLNASINLNSYAGNSGKLTTVAWTAGGSTQNSTKLNFNGGTLIFGATGSTDYLSTSTASVNLYANGGTIDTNGNSNTITQVISNPADNGITSVTFSGTSNTYDTPPTVTFSGGVGTNPTGYAALDASGNINGIVITNGGSFTGTVTASISGQTGTYTINTAANSTGGLTKSGLGTLTLTNVSTYSGATTINGGTLALNATGSIDNTSGVALGGGTLDVSAKGSGGYAVNNLSGNGAVLGTLNVSTQLAIGGTTQTISFQNLGLGASSTYLYDLTGGTTAADLGNVSGTIAISNGALLDLVQLGTYTANEKFTLFGYQTGNLTGTFAGLADGAEFTDAGGVWKINYSDTSAGLNGGTGTSFVTITAVPEPNVTALLGALGMLALLRRRR